MVICCCLCSGFFFFKQKTAYEMRISDWSSDVCSSDLHGRAGASQSDVYSLIDLAKCEGTGHRGGLAGTSGGSRRIAAHHQNRNRAFRGDGPGGLQRSADSIIADDDHVRCAYSCRFKSLPSCPAVVERAKSERFQIMLDRATDDPVVVDDQCMSHSRLLAVEEPIVAGIDRSRSP